MTSYIIFGASRGLGALFSHSLPAAGDTVWLVSRSQPDVFESDGVQRIWIQADLARSGSGAQIAAAIGDTVLDICLYNAGIWERTAFSDRYDYEQVAEDETEQILRVNLISAITCIQKLLPALRGSNRAKIILIGSNAGLENARRPEVAYVASKFGLRGLAHALREIVRQDLIGVTCLNLGDVGTITMVNGQLQVETGSAGRILIDPSDIVLMLKAVISLSNTSCVKELDLLAMSDEI